MSLFLPVIEAFNREKVEYVAVGGMAAIAHGVNRYTADIDFVIRLDADNAERAVSCLTALGFKPRAPVDPRRFADARQRAAWIEEKGMMVFSFYDPNDPFLAIDLFVDYPMDFTGLWDRSVLKAAGGLRLRVCGLEDLIAMKRKAGRPKDLEDIQVLERMRDDG